LCVIEYGQHFSGWLFLTGEIERSLVAGCEEAGVNDALANNRSSSDSEALRSCYLTMLTLVLLRGYPSIHTSCVTPVYLAQYMTGLAMPHEESASRCIVSLVDYAEVVDCETKMVFDVGDQPQIVRDLPAAAFKFRMKNVDGPWEDEEKMPRLHEEETYAVDLQGKGARGVFFGSARFVLQKVSKQPCVSDDEQSAALIFESGYKGEASMMETEDEELRALTEREEGLKLCMELMQEEQDKFCR
uniref:Kinesin motor domain-containing protein n=1 Tax=Toxocara canis TaxID=6265 RepID=A0A183VAT1_TOXCA